MMLDAFFVALAVFVGVAGHELFGMAMLSRPIVVAPLAGLLLGDVQTGLIVGASLESIFMGVVNIGISSTAEPALAAGLATAFAIIGVPASKLRPGLLSISPESARCLS